MELLLTRGRLKYGGFCFYVRYYGRHLHWCRSVNLARYCKREIFELCVDLHLNVVDPKSLPFQLANTVLTFLQSCCDYIYNMCTIFLPYFTEQ